MRLFFAVPFGEETLDRLCAAQELLRARANRGRFSPRENLHLTLAFLGELPPSRLDALDRAVKSIPFPPFEAKFDRLGCFRRPGGSIWWAGLRPTPQLLAIQRSLSDALQRESASCTGMILNMAINYGGREELVHAARTLARQVEPDHLFPDGVPALRFSAPVGSIVLMESRREGPMMRYFPLLTRHAVPPGTQPSHITPKERNSR